MVLNINFLLITQSLSWILVSLVDYYIDVVTGELAITLDTTINNK
uniref:Uncharacterized protein n=1 Tax=Rhizophora mucronata TaxID=61149 RepID=A0A2P2PB08_RHIMU